MKVKIKFSYTEDEVPPGCRKSRHVHYDNGMLECQIPEISATEAPIAIIAMRNRGAIFPSSTVEYRWHGGQLWTRYRVRDAQKSSHTCGKKDYNHPRIPATLNITTGWAGCKSNDAGLQYYCYKSKRDITRELRAQMKDHLIIGGKFYRSAGEPRYVVMTFGLGQNHGGTAVMIDDHYNSNISKARYFTLLELDKAKALATDIATRRGDTRSLPIKPIGPRLKVLNNEAIRLNPKKQHGNGDPFMNELEALTEMGEDNTTTAVMAMVIATKPDMHA